MFLVQARPFESVAVFALGILSLDEGEDGGRPSTGGKHPIRAVWSSGKFFPSGQFARTLPDGGIRNRQRKRLDRGPWAPGGPNRPRRRPWNSITGASKRQGRDPGRVVMVPLYCGRRGHCQGDLGPQRTAHMTGTIAAQISFPGAGQEHEERIPTRTRRPERKNPGKEGGTAGPREFGVSWAGFDNT